MALNLNDLCVVEFLERTFMCIFGNETFWGDFTWCARCCVGTVFNQILGKFSHFLTNTPSCDLQMVECCAIT